MSKYRNKSDQKSDFYKKTLDRTDASIRFAESKSGFLFTLASILFGLWIEKSSILQKIIDQENCHNKFYIISFFLSFMGILIVLVSTFIIVFPMKEKAEKTSYLFFGSISKMDEEKYYKKMKQLNLSSINNQFLSEIYTTSIIAKNKFFWVKIEIIGLIIIILGLVLEFVFNTFVF